LRTRWISIHNYPSAPQKMNTPPDLSFKNPFAQMFGVPVEQVRIGELVEALPHRNSRSFTQSDIQISPLHQIAYGLGVKNGEPAVCTSKDFPCFEPLRRGDLVMYHLPSQGEITLAWVPFATFCDTVNRINSSRLIRVVKHAQGNGVAIEGSDVLAIMYLTDFLHLEDNAFQNYSNETFGHEFKYEFEISQFGSRWTTIPDPRKEKCAGVF